MMGRTARQSFIASVHDDYMDRMDQIADNLRSKGCEIDEILKLSGVITGHTKQNLNLNDLNIEGVASIEKQRVLRKKSRRKRQSDNGDQNLRS
ncbi:MAG: hypothetical protein JXB00_20240 [Bacteroidales bacterium]|nr:hypothetical protein [Bacteroidales bacterium]